MPQLTVTSLVRTFTATYVYERIVLPMMLAASPARIDAISTDGVRDVRFFDRARPWLLTAARRSLSRTQPGSIVLLHDCHQGQRLAQFLTTLDGYLAEAKERGFHFIALSEACVRAELLEAGRDATYPMDMKRRAKFSWRHDQEPAAMSKATDGRPAPPTAIPGLRCPVSR